MKRVCKYVVAAGLLWGMTGCATPYIPPTGPIPPGWTGRSGRALVPGTTQVHLGPLQAGGSVFESEIRFVRTGIVAESIQTKNAFGRDIIVPKGAKAYAVNYTLMRNGKVAQSIDPIEWCVILPDGIDGKGDGSQTICAFWETDQRTRYFEDFRIGGFRFNVDLRGGGASGMLGPVLQISEGPVDFGVTLKRQLRVLDFDNRGMRLAYVLTDGTDSDNEDVFERRWDDNPPFNIPDGSGRIHITPSADFKSLIVEPWQMPQQ
ncbi:MAG TPA: hypothetical protein VG501_08450 [Rhizomicrobium sp.]|nr:hypothetical protein [Rhizomicrobium sp.]